MVSITSPHNLLIVEDSIGDARLVQEILKNTDFDKYETTFVHTLDELTVFKYSRFHAILLDLHLSDVKPLDTFRIVNNLFPTTPIIVLTGLKDDILAAKIVREGAQDYLIKGTFDSDMLQRSLKYSIYRKKAEQRMARQKRNSQKLMSRADLLQKETIRLANINKAKDVFLSIASHQLRTPATAVKQYVGMILHGFAGELEPKQQQFLEIAYRSNERQLKIVDDLLKVARLDTGHVTLNKTSTDLVELIRSVIDDIHDVTARKKQKILLEAKDSEVIANVDGDNLRMVFENLLDNASKYSGEATEIKVEVIRDARWVHCNFRDSGIGISSRDQKKLFQKFSRLDDSFVIDPNGSGLGLYWANEIVKLHRGKVALVSKKGKGSLFSVTLPAAPDEK
jgi:two-component system sensor histidine kinase/response regulator